MLTFSPLEAALKYHELGLSVIPLKQNKRPYLNSWTEYQKRRPTEQEVREWWGPKKWPTANIGIITGEVSGILVLDVESKEGYSAAEAVLGDDFQYTLVQNTGKPNGQHFLYRHPKNGNTYPNWAKKIKDCDFRGDGGYIMVAPSVHPNGKVYKWDEIDPLEQGLDEMADAPKELLEICDEVVSGESGVVSKNPEGWVNDLLFSGVEEGERNEKIAKLAGYYFAKYDWDEARVLAQILVFNYEKCRPPLKREEVEKTVRSIGKYHEPKIESMSRKEFEALINNEDDFDILTDEIAKKISDSDLKPSDKLCLRKLIAKKIDVSVASLEADSHIFKNKQNNSEDSHIETARGIVDSIGKDKVICFADSFFLWRPYGVWEPVDDREIGRQALELYKSEKLTKNSVSSILELTKTLTYRQEHKWDVGGELSINCTNGELAFSQESWQLQPHIISHYRTSQIPTAYEPEAEAPRFQQFLKEVFRDDDEADKKIMMVLEVIGYCLLATSKYEKFVILVGPGANGKSVLLSVLKELLGPKNISAVQPNQLDNKFQRAHMHGRLANLVTEIPEGHQIADAELKAITSGELITAEHKFKPPFEFEPFCTCVFATNHLPHTRDFSEALFRRAIVIRFNRIFQEHEQDRSLTDKLKGELPGIFNLALDAVAVVIKRGGVFTTTKESDDAKSAWRTEVDQAAQFVNDCCIVDEQAEETIENLYAFFTRWAESGGIRKPLTRKSFSQRLVNRLGFERDRATDSGRARLIKGLQLMPGRMPWTEE